jgi:hypothetical protein
VLQEILERQWASELLEAPALREFADVDRREAELLDQR